MSHTTAAQSGPATSAAIFAAWLQAEYDALAGFIDLLRTEQEILIQGDAERLALLAPDKTAKIDLLTVLGEQRSGHLAAEGLSDGARGMQTWLSRNGGFAATVGKTWRELLARAETARQMNLINGLLIESGLRQNRLKLTALQNAAASDGVYRPDGQLRTLRSARALSQA